MFDRIANSFSLARSSWNVLRTDKQLLVFPIISGILCLMVTISFAAPFVALLVIQGKQPEELPQWMYYVAAFGYYFVTYFMIIFCNAALTSCALMRFNGQTPTLGAGIQAAASRLPQIL